MILTILILINSCIFLGLSLLHFYWVFGGSWGINYAIPEKFKESYFDNKNKTKNQIATLIVALGLLLFALIMVSYRYVVFSYMSKESNVIAIWMIAAIFMLRAIGEFNIVGIFKKPSDSMFAKKDNQIYIPLCLYLSLSSVLITFL